MRHHDSRPTFRTIDGVQVARRYIDGGNRVLITRKTAVGNPFNDDRLGNFVTAYVNHAEVASETVRCIERWEPETPNQLGQPGAYASHPDREKLQAIALRMAREHGLPIQDNPGVFE